MKKLLFYLVIALLCTACAGARNQPAAPSPMEQDQSAMSFALPEAWALTQESPESFHLIRDAALMAVTLESSRGLLLEELAYAMALGLEAGTPARDGEFFRIDLEEGRDPVSEEAERVILLNIANNRLIILFLYDPDQEYLPVARDLLRSIVPHPSAYLQK